MFWLLCVGLPMQALALASMWVGESKRADRAGRYMVWIEAEVDELIAHFDSKDELLTRWLSAPNRKRPRVGMAWETSLRIRLRNGLDAFGTNQLMLPYLALALYLAAMSLAPIAVFMWLAASEWNQPRHWPAIASLLVTGTYLIVLGGWLMTGVKVENVSRQPIKGLSTSDCNTRNAASPPSDDVQERHAPE
jgi:hypothetical protein